VAQAAAHLIHLASRFFGALDPRGPSLVEEAWATALLGEGERRLWRRMSGPDRRHAVGVAHDVERRLGPAATPPVLAAALLHDVGKVEAGLGTVARVPATILGLVDRDRFAAGHGRVARYLRHDVIGADLLAAAGADRLTVAWAREHHLRPDAWSVPAEVGAALKAADGD
jgi:hypothetical protein